MGQLDGKTALVTGGSRGIGRAIATRLARDGALVAVHGSTDDSGLETVDAIVRAGGRATAVGARLGTTTDAEDLWSAFDQALERQGAPAGVDIIVNNAGTTTRGGLAGATRETFDDAVAVDVRAPFFVVQQALSRLRDGGRIVNLSTALARLARPDTIVYSMCKAAIGAFTMNLAVELGGRGITVNSVAPGVIVTEINADWLQQDEQIRVETANRAALRRLGDVDEVADAVAFIVSEDARFVTGHLLEVSGGLRVGESLPTGTVSRARGGGGGRVAAP